MKNIKSNPNRVAIIMTGLFITFILFLSIKKTAQAITSHAQVVTILIQIESELLPSMPAGQYYEGLYFRHFDELSEIYSHDPYHSVAFTYPRLLLFIPGLGALVNGKGSTEIITSEQVNALQEEVNWLVEHCKPSLCRDIGFEEERFPLNSFIGLTYQEAWDYIITGDII